jgi:chromate transporter
MAALRFWFKLGFISFGGPAGQIALMHKVLVDEKRWISDRRFLHALNYCMVLPGPEAQQLATYIGWLMHRTAGGIAAGALFVLPSLFILIGLSWIYVVYGNTPVVAAIFYGIKPAVTAIVLHAAWRIGSRTLSHPGLWAIALAAFGAIWWLQVPFPMIVLGAALVGYMGGRLVPQVFAGRCHGGKAGASLGAVIDDDTLPPPHASCRKGRTVVLSLIGLALWAFPMAALWLAAGWDGTLTQMGWFFTKAALLTFGGAYAVLPYVMQGAVLHYGWLSAAQMIDGLALGETTPGPLIMVVAFVAFVGGWQTLPFGPDHALAAAVAAACLVTWFTFLPSFLFILIGAPLVEATRQTPHLQAPLTAITAAVVGVIVNLAMIFGIHVLWPNGMNATFDWCAMLIGLAAGLALFRFKTNVMLVIGLAAVAGMVLLLPGS